MVTPQLRRRHLDVHPLIPRHSLAGLLDFFAKLPLLNLSVQLYFAGAPYSFLALYRAVVSPRPRTHTPRLLSSTALSPTFCSSTLIVIPLAHSLCVL